MITVHLRAGEVSVLLDFAGGRLPAVVHWGGDLGGLTRAEATALVRAGVAPIGENVVDEPVRVSVIPEHWTGWVGRPGISGSRAGRDWSPKFSVVAVRINGEPLPDEAGLVETGPAVMEADARDDVAELDLTITIELTGSGLLRLRASLTNTGDETYQVDDVVLALPVPTRGREILDLAGRWGKERFPQRRELVTGTHLREGRKGRTGADAATVLHVGAPGFGFAEGEIWAVHTGWSGNHTHYAERLFTGDQVVGGGELLLPGEVRLEQDETYATPWLYASYGIGLDEVARRFHRFLRARPDHPTSERPVTLNVWEAVYFDHDLERLLELVDRAADLGVERYVLDDGWFGSRRNDRSGLGDWTVSPDAWPDGLHPLVDRVRKRGMQFGLWFEPEMINLDSDIARAHPEWIMSTGNRLPVSARHQQVINLGIPECYTYIRDAISALLAEYEIDYIKWDHNRDLVDAGTQPGGQPGVHAQTVALYSLLAELRAAHPRLEIESCSSGGARVDLGILEHAERVWVSDCIDPLERQQMHRWTTQLIPPEMMGAHVASGRSHTTGRSHDLSFRAATAVFGHLGIEWDLTLASEVELDELSQWVAFYKEHRRLLLDGDLVRVEMPDRYWNIFGVVAPDRSAAVFSCAYLDRAEAGSPGRLTMPGLDPDRRYRVEPLIIGEPPHGLRPAPWWGLRRVGLGRDDVPEHGLQRVHLAADGDFGVVLPGRALAYAGLMAPQIDAEQAVLYKVTAVGD
jgi:alpha-galactosidase